MKFSINRGDFEKAVGWASKAAPTHSTHPITTGMKIVATGDQVMLSAFDYDISSVATLTAAVDEPGIAIPSAKVLSTIVGSLPKAPVDVEIREQMLIITCGSATASIPVMLADDYPALPSMTESIGEVDAEALANAVKQTAPAVGDPKSFAVLQGILFHFTPNGLALVATDRYRISKTIIPFTWDWEPQTIAAIVPPKMLQAFVSGTKGAVQILASEYPQDGDLPTMIGLSNGGRESTTRLIAGKFPNYQPIVPPIASPVVATVDTAELLGALKRAQGAEADEQMAKARVTIGGDRIRLEAGVEVRVDDEVSAKVDGDEMSTIVQLKILVDAVDHLGADVTRISTKQPAPGKGVALLLTPGVDPEDVRHQHVVMSIRS